MGEGNGSPAGERPQVQEDVNRIRKKPERGEPLMTGDAKAADDEAEQAAPSGVNA